MSIELSSGASSTPKVAIQLPYHVSYPYLFENKGEIYCVPETREAKEIGLYRSEEFPSRWRKVATLVRDFAGVDSTVFRYGRYLWLTSADRVGSLFRLHIWYSEDLLGPWRSHMANPVKSDIRSTRPAGTPFMYDGHLFRPAQDCSRTYGGRIVLNRVTCLEPTEFAEQQAGTLEPFADSPYPDGLHTICALENMTLVDAKRIVFARSAFKHDLMRPWAIFRRSLLKVRRSRPRRIPEGGC